VKQRVSEIMDANLHYLGSSTDALEAGLGARFQKRHVVTTHAGTAALLLALRALELEPTDEVLIPASTYAACAECVMHAGARPVFTDCEPDTGNIDAGNVIARLTPRTRAVMVVHQNGHPADLDPILELATRRRLWVIENCCHAFLARYKGRPVGSLGDIGFLAMSHKHLTVCGTGGAAFTDDDAIAKKMRMMRHHGNWGTTLQAAYEIQMLGYKMYLNEIQAAIGADQLAVANQWVEARRRNAATYTRLLTEARAPIELPPQRDYAWSSYLHYVIRTDDRDALREHLLAQGIEAKIHFAIPIHLHRAFARAFGIPRGTFPAAERLCDRVLSLPVAPHVTDADVHTVVGHIGAFFASAHGRRAS
jgi:dTDP-3-amino-3,4,6-trideoxy-alpha-D-glucose transaminase